MNGNNNFDYRQRNVSQNNAYNSGQAPRTTPPQNRQYYGSTQGRPTTPNQRPRPNGSSGYRVPNGDGRRPMPQRQPQKPSYFNWQTIFVILLAIMVIVGIIATVVNSRKNKAAYKDEYDANDTSVNTETTDPFLDSYAADTLGAALAVTYAIKTNDTLKLTDEISSDYAIMIDLDNNTIVAEKGGDDMIFPASMTKVMTLIVAYENCKDLDDTFTMTADITDPLFTAGASVAGFSVGEEITIKDLLYGAILPSGADATDALAIYTAGSIEKFVAMMNKKVLQLGLSNTHFSNPSGLHEKNHYSTPHEMALIFEYALKIPECREILSTYKYTTRATSYHPDGITLTSTMFSRMKGDESGVAEIIAGKTGYTTEGQHCLVSLGARNDNGKEYVLVTAHASATYDPVYDCINIYKELFGEN